jgi:phosphatidylglycerophosphatase A
MTPGGASSPVRPRAGPLSWALATWFGCGLVPIAPGTAGALGAVPVYLFAMHFGRVGGVALASVLVTILGIVASSRVAAELGKKDPQVIVIDEVAGMLVTMLPVHGISPRAILVGFILFRLLDILKPWPVRSFERLPAGWGIVLDDVVAGILGAFVMAILVEARVLP